MMRESRLFLNALQFLTRLPVPSADVLNEDWLFRSAKYFPAVGLLIGGLSAAVFLFAGLVWSGAIPAILAVTTSVLITGAFHEDGLADTVDGLGGGQTIAARLDIMKDSRVGTYGAIALILSMTTRIAVLASLPPLIGVCALLAMHSLARLPPLIALKVMPHAGDQSTAKTSYQGLVISPVEILLGATFAIVGLVPLALLSLSGCVMGLVGGAALAAWVAMKSSKLIKGYTGDVLGAIEQMFELGFLLGLFAAFSS